MGRTMLALCILAVLCSAQAARPAVEPAQMQPRGKSSASARLAHVKYDASTGSMTVVQSKHSNDAKDDSAPAWASYTEQSATLSNFGRLRVESSGNFPDDVQLRAMGYVEGYLSAQAILDHWLNMQWYLSVSTNDTDKINAWLVEQREWIQSGVAANKDNADNFWYAQGLIMQQVEGIAGGYAAYRAEQVAAGRDMQALTVDDIMLLNAFGDMDDLIPMMQLKAMQEQKQKLRTTAASQTAAAADDDGEEVLLHPVWDTLGPHEARVRIAKSGHCSALIKVTSDLSDILMGHTTWWSYSSLLRVYKNYITHLANPAIKAQHLSFSSYPGLVTSMDDFFVLSSGMVVMETSNDIYNLNLYKLSTNKAALSWQRSRAACMLASTGPEWALLIQTHNSGTYNNQYMVVDLKRFTPGQELQHGLLTVVEVMPGGAYTADTTQELERGYWPSYNIPYFVEVYNQTGYPDVRAKLSSMGNQYHGVSAGLSYQLAPRAKIFRRDSGDVDSLGDLKRVLRSNGWKPSGSKGSSSDPFSPTPWDAICARGDLDPHHPDASGCYDAKLGQQHAA